MWLALGVGAFACAYAALHQVGNPTDTALSCGLGLPPDAPGFAVEQGRRALEARQKGYEAVCEVNLERFRIAFQPADRAISRLEFHPVDLSGTPFATFKTLGATPESMSGQYSRVYRGFRMPDGHTVTLFEHDMSVDGSSSWRAPGDDPERINGLPARLGIFQAPSGNAISHLSWVERRRSYELWIDANVAHSPLRDQLFSLAASLPASLPGCPNEVLPRPMRPGADGMPDFGSVPATLPLDATGTGSSGTKRRCK